MSGTAESTWAMSDEKDHVSIANYMAENMETPKNSLDDLISFLKTAPAEKLSEHFHDVILDNFRIKFAPIIESECKQF